MMIWPTWTGTDGIVAGIWTCLIFALIAVNAGLYIGLAWRTFLHVGGYRPFWVKPSPRTK